LVNWKPSTPLRIEAHGLQEIPEHHTISMKSPTETVPS